ncbi:hypothetical protein H310_03125 [Aphanomyces invadans]|uniref:Uncharacterized protein n=1 Tax=Aphanomyces invadans TaxID=157072 RepID=A0A024UL63_9STRA|nr:hypothetical protein H310_03125 [Aphanomyces invadans]ETW07039.1 hypothetical protein H310_03125 [Aphanomyces invadans]|eukprot:XP_008865114.1 hypothetical protein H310_03125 [Aphanomyces invadans]
MASSRAAVQQTVATSLVEKHQRVKDAMQAMKRTMATEFKKTKALLGKWSIECTEVCLRHNDREVATAQKVAKLGLCHQQLRSERNKALELQQQLWKDQAKHERIAQQLHDELDETRDHLQVLMQVKVGLVADAHASRERLHHGEMAEAALRQDRARLTKLNQALHQQLQILQHTHARDMERALLHHSHVGKNKVKQPPLNQTDEDIPTAEDWSEFLDLIMVHREEVHLRPADPPLSSST